MNKLLQVGVVVALGTAQTAFAAGTVMQPEVVIGANGVREMRGPTFVSDAVAPTSHFVDIRQLPALRPWQPGDPIREMPRRYEAPAISDPVPLNPVAPGLDKLAERQRAWDRENVESAPITPNAFTTPLLNFEGQGYTSVEPSDVNGDIGPAHFVQSINGNAGSLVQIYDKTTGATVGPAFQMKLLGAATGNCPNGTGDPVILFDELANRWILTEFTPDGANDLCVYISNGSSPVAATWTRYNFTMPSFPDYPHYGVWPDAFYVGANESGNAGMRPVYAFDRVKMLAGQPATFQRLLTPSLDGFGFQTWQPADIDGGAAPPPAGAPGIFMRHRDDEAHNSGSNNPAADFLEYAQLQIDFVTPANTILTGPTSISITEFDSTLNGLTAPGAFAQPNGTTLDPLRELVMNRLAYRNFGSHESMVGVLVTDIANNDRGGLRWFEVRRTGGIANPWVLYQEGTYAPADAGGQADRWMGALAMDKMGNIALGYSITRQAPAIAPSLRYVGRQAGDPLGVMTTGETTLVAGGGSQDGQRWGDYHSMGVDPIDGCTFWIAASYMPGTEWSTRMGSFRFDSCNSATDVIFQNGFD